MKKADITPGLVSRLVAAQFPQWAGLPVRRVEVDGWDNATFRLGERLSVRLPSSPAYAGQVAKEHRWLAVLAPQLPLPIPEPLAMGAPGRDFPRPWSVYRWIEGQTAQAGPVASLPELAADLAGFLAALHRADPSGGPEPGPHNFFRGGSPGYYDAETRTALAALHGHIDTGRAAEVWETALAAPRDGPPAWFHGDAQPGNLLLDSSGRLSAVIDFGTSGIGDPACDTTIAWTFFSGPGQRRFQERLPADEATWARGRGWAIWKAMIVLARALDTDPDDAEFTKAVIGKIIADHRDAR
ncbi:MAG TPA: aminoglycoside phosphotransferase family protein [Streptosporangiaceae bacterium]